MDPATLILSYGSVSPVEITENILTQLNQPRLLATNSYESTVINSYKCDIRTKYYSTSVSLIPFEGKLEGVPTEIKKLTEALIIYFDPTDRSFIKCISEINDFIKDSEIQIGFLVTTSFTGAENELTFEKLKDVTDVVLDIVTLKEDAGKSENTQETGYAEILEGLRNCVWSNIKIGSSRKDSNSAEELENQLNDFEKLLITAQSLRSNTNLTRDEILNKAEQFAEVMSAILNDNE